MTPESRRCPFTGRTVIVAPERAHRPQEHSQGEPQRIRNATSALTCPFCPGQEHDTPQEVLAVRDAGTLPDCPGWQLRVVPNKFPAVRTDAPAGLGLHEVIIECAEHDPPHGLSVLQHTEVFGAVQQRMLLLKRDARWKHLQWFRNVGLEAGASQAHPHSQLVALPFVPDVLQTERTFATATRSDLVALELAAGLRVVLETQQFVALCPFASRLAYEVWILPKSTTPHFLHVGKDGLQEMATVLHGVLRALDVRLHAPAYNVVLHMLPDEQDQPEPNWRVEILPRNARIAGFEWATGCFINTMPPELAAQLLRQQVG